MVRKIWVRLNYYRCCFRGLLMTLWIRLWGGTVGRGLVVEKGVVFRHAPSRNWILGQDIYLGVGVIVDVWPTAEFVVRDGVKVMHGVVLGVRQSLIIGSESQVAEYSSVRDADHGMAAGVLMKDAAMTASAISIGHNVWVARGVAVLAGSSIGAGSVIGANSVVKGVIPPDSIAVGAPARVIRGRV